MKVPKYGQAELVEAETSFTAYQEFQSMLTRDRIDILWLENLIIKYSKVYIVFLWRTSVDLQFSYSQPYVNVVKEKIEPRLVE